MSDDLKPTTKMLSNRSFVGPETLRDLQWRIGGCKCHAMTFCPDLEFVGYEDDQPVFVAHAALEKMEPEG